MGAQNPSHESRNQREANMSRARIATPSRTRNYTIELMNEHDLLDVVEIEHACRLSKWGWEAYYSELTNGALMLVARARMREPSSHLVYGFAAARLAADQLHINNIGVRPASRRAGVGHELLAELLRRARARGAREAHLEVRPGNEAAIALYDRHNFRVTGRRPRYYVDPPDDALLMSADLNA